MGTALHTGQINTLRTSEASTIQFHNTNITMAPLEEMHTANVNRSIRTIKAELEYLCDASIISPQQLSDLLQRMPEQTALHAPISVGAIPQGTPGALQPPTSPLHNLNLQNGNRNRVNGQANNEKKDNPYFQPAAQAWKVSFHAPTSRSLMRRHQWRVPATITAMRRWKSAKWATEKARCPEKAKRWARSSERSWEMLPFSVPVQRLVATS